VPNAPIEVRATLLMYGSIFFLPANAPWGMVLVALLHSKTSPI